MPKLFGFGARRLKPQRLEIGTTAAVLDVAPLPPPQPRLFAFTTTAGGARCFDFADDLVGRRALARHIRAENCVRVVRGYAVDIHHTDVVSIDDTEPDTKTLPGPAQLWPRSDSDEP